MWVLGALIIGSLTGIFVGSRLRRNFDLLIINAFAGIVGALLGLGISYLIHPGEAGNTGVAWVAALCELLGALLAVTSFSLLHRVTEKHTKTRETIETEKPE